MRVWHLSKIVPSLPIWYRKSQAKEAFRALTPLQHLTLSVGYPLRPCSFSARSLACFRKRFAWRKNIQKGQDLLHAHVLS